MVNVALVGHIVRNRSILFCSGIPKISRVIRPPQAVPYFRATVACPDRHHEDQEYCESR